MSFLNAYRDCQNKIFRRLFRGPLTVHESNAVGRAKAFTVALALSFLDACDCPLQVRSRGIGS
jgi:hypothetical protein